MVSLFYPLQFDHVDRSHTMSLSIVTLPTRNFDALIVIVLRRYFAHSELAHTWSTLARVCRGWAAAVAQFDLAVLTPRQLYYDAAAIAHHNITPPIEVWYMLPHNVIVPPQFDRVTERAPSGLVVTIDTANVPLSELPPQLGWPNGTEAVAALLRKWGAPPGWGHMISLWHLNGAIEAVRITTPYRNDDNRNWDICVVARRRDGSRCTTMNIPDARYIDWDILRQAMENGRSIAALSPCQSHLISMIKSYIIHRNVIAEHILRECVDALDYSSFNLMITCAIGDNHIDLIAILAQSNAAQPRYEPLYFVPRLGQRWIAATLASMCAGRACIASPHPYPLHVPTRCRECASL